MPERRLDIVLGDVDDEVLKRGGLLARQTHAFAVVANAEDDHAALCVREARQILRQFVRRFVLAADEAHLPVLDDDFVEVDTRILASLDLAQQLIERVVHWSPSTGILYRAARSRRLRAWPGAAVAAYHGAALNWPATDPAPAVPLSASAPAGTLDPYERHYLRRLLLYGFLVRAGLALLLETTGYSRLLAPDEETYATSGWGMALFWAGDLLLKPWRFNTHQPLGYFYINAAFFSVFGHSELPLKLTNALLGALTGRYVYFIARALFGPAVARRSALYAAFFPSLVLWSAVNIRDVWVILLILFVSWKSLQVVKGRSLMALLAVVAAVYALTFLRDYLFFVVALPPLVAFLIGGRGNLGRNFVVALLAALVLLLLFQQGAVSERAVSHLSLEAMSRVRQDMATGGSAFHDNVDISTPARALAFLPLGIAYFLFSPFPWQITSTLKLFSLPEMLLIYSLAPAMLRGIRHTIRTRFREALQVLLLTALLTVSYALGEGNVGTLYRHRAQAILFYLMFAGVGLELRRDAVRAADARDADGLPSPAA